MEEKQSCSVRGESIQDTGWVFAVLWWDKDTVGNAAEQRGAAGDIFYSMHVMYRLYSTWHASYKTSIHSFTYTHLQSFTANWRNVIDQSQAGSGCAETQAVIGREALSVTKSDF